MSTKLGPSRSPETEVDSAAHTSDATDERGRFVRPVRTADVDPRQDDLANPFGMDEDCQHCPALCESRSTVVHGYGDATADFLFVGTAPTAGADRTGHPFTGDEAGETVLSILRRLGLCASPADASDPDLHNAYLTYLTRCHHPDRGPTDEEIRNCDPFLNSELRTINPEIIVPVGDRALSTLAVEYTTTDAEALSIEERHASSIRGRGFELVPMADPAALDEAGVQAFVEHFSELMAGDYRQTKGRRER